MPGNSIKSAGKYKIMVKLYENQSAEIQITIIGQVLKTETPHAPARPPRRRREENAAEGQPASQAETGSPVAAVEATETAVQEVPSSEADSSSNNTENSAAPETADGEPAEE
jgi:large subunit ribosomal protein L9